MKHIILSTFCCALLGCSKPSPAPTAAPEPATVAPEAEPDPVETPVKSREAITLKLNEPLDHPQFSGPLVLREFVIESVEPDPSDPDDVGGAGIQIELDIGSETISTYINAAVDAPNAVAWTDEARLEVVGYDTNPPSVDVHLDQFGDPVEAEVVKLSLRRGETGDIGGVMVRFDAHSHKSLEAGQRSPLMMQLTYDPTGEQVREYFSLFPPEEATWRWRNYDLHLVGFAYDERIDIEVRRRRLAPVEKP